MYQQTPILSTMTKKIEEQKVEEQKRFISELPVDEQKRIERVFRICDESEKRTQELFREFLNS